MKMKIVPDVISRQNLVVVSSEISVLEAAKMMAANKIGAIMIGEGTTLKGIFTERDLAFKIVATSRDPGTVKVAEVMTANPDTIRPDETAQDALERMTKGGYRHLPVVDNGRLLGIVSIRDIYAAVLREAEEALHDRESFIQGSAGYGLN